MQLDSNYSLVNQNYSKKSTINGVEIIPLRTFPEEGGLFCENLRIQENGQISYWNALGEQKILEKFILRQINSSVLRPETIKAWHIHKLQTDVWMVPPGGGHLFVGLWDLREDSPTHKIFMRIYLGEYHIALLRIPPGVAHGARALENNSALLTYFIDQHFNPEDEFRLSWDALAFNWDIENG